MPPADKILSKKPRLLIILNRFVIGGQAVDTIPLAWYLQEDFEVLILYGEKEKDEVEPDYLLDYYPGLQLKKIRQLRRSINPIIDIFAFISIIKVLLSYQPHLVHTHGAKSGFIGRVASKITRVPVIIHTFHGHFFHSYFSKTLSRLIVFVERAIGKITTSAVALSIAQKSELAEVYEILPAKKIRIIPLGFAFDQANNEKDLRKSFREKYGLTENDVAVGIVGRIVPVKNHFFFVHVINEVLNKDGMKKAAFFIIGDGELRLQVEKELQQKNLAFNEKEISETCRVVFTSWLTNMYEVMNGLDIVALTSLNEGTPLSVIEAQFFKKPVISTNVGGVKDTLEDGVTGFLTERGDITTFSDKLRLLINEPALRTTMGEAGYTFAAKKFSKQREITLVKQYYFDLLQQKGYYFK